MKLPAMKADYGNKLRAKWLLAGAGTALAVLAVTASVEFAQAQTPVVPHDRRSQMSPERAMRMEALLLKMFPGASLDWNSEQVVYPDGRRLRFNFGLYQEKPQPKEGATFIIASPAPEDRHDKAIGQIQLFKDAGADLPHCKLHLLRIDATSKVLGYKEGEPDIGEFASHCTGVNFGYAYESAGVVPPQHRGLSEPAWPWVVVNYMTYHVLPDAWASIVWAAVLDSESMQWVSRLPVFFNGQRRDRKSAAFAIRNDRGATSGGQWLFYGFNERGDEPKWQVSLPCKLGSCKVAPQGVLDAAFQSAAWK